MTTVDMSRCWGSKPSSVGNPVHCHSRVPLDPDHIGLCDECLEAKREGQQ